MIITLMLLVCVLPCFSQEVIEKDREVVFKSVNIVPMDRESIIQNQSVVVKNGKIQSIGAPKKVKYNYNGLGRYGKIRDVYFSFSYNSTDFSPFGPRMVCLYLSLPSNFISMSTGLPTSCE